MKSRFKLLYKWVDEIRRNLISFDVLLNLSLVVTEITERIENLCNCKVRQSAWNLFWRKTHPPDFHDCSNGSPSTFDDWFPCQNILVLDNVAMLSRCLHDGYYYSLASTYRQPMAVKSCKNRYFDVIQCGQVLVGTHKFLRRAGSIRKPLLYPLSYRAMRVDESRVCASSLYCQR